MLGDKHLFDTERGEREWYTRAEPNEAIRLPITRDGFEALLERCANFFLPPLPVDDSMRAVLAGYVHRLNNETNESTVEALAKVLWKSVSNSVTWTIDQEVKAKARAMEAERNAKLKAEQDELNKQAALASADAKREKKAGKKLTMVQKRK